MKYLLASTCNGSNLVYRSMYICGLKVSAVKKTGNNDGQNLEHLHNIGGSYAINIVQPTLGESLKEICKLCT